MSNLNQFVRADRAMIDNHIIDWNGAKIIDKEPKRKPRQAKVAIWIKTVAIPMNGDLGNYELPYMYEDIVGQ